MTDHTMDKLIKSVYIIEPNLQNFNIGVEINPENNEAWIFYRGIPESAYAGSARFLYYKIREDIRRLKTYKEF